MRDTGKLLAKYGVRVQEGKVAKNEEEAVALAKKIGFPVALKIVSKKILHKSDAGAVKLNLHSGEEARLAYRAIMANVRGKPVEGMLVQKMAREGVELIVGGKRDAQFGQMIVFGIGGIFVEIYMDVSMRACPIGMEDAHEMMKEIRGIALLQGARGKKEVDTEKIAQLLVSVSKFLEKEQPLELDLNPVIADDRGYDIVDVRAIWQEKK